MKAKRTISCSKSKLKEIRQFVREQLEPLPFSNLNKQRIILAVDEACANAIIHGHHCNPDKTLEVEMSIENGVLNVKIHDIGEANFDELLNFQENIEDIIEKKKKGGLGLRLIHNVMDEVDYYHHNDTNICSLTKRLPN